MPILNGMTTDYGQDAGAFIVGSMITKGIYAIDDINESYNPIDLNFGTNGSVNFVVGGGNDDPNIIEELKLTTIFKGGYNFPVYNFESTGQHAISFSPGDQHSTVYVGDAVFYSDAANVYLTSFTKKLNLLTDEMTLDGSLKSLQNLRVDGQVYTPEVNITRNFFNNVDTSASNLLGFAFRINDDQNLELIKYKHNENYLDSNLCQLVATFGKGKLLHDPSLTYNLYEDTNSATLQDDEFRQNNNELDGSGNLGNETYWKQTPADANNIHFGGFGNTQQYVGINNIDPKYHLDVYGTVNALKFTDGHVEIDNGYVRNIKVIEVSSAPGEGLKFKDLIQTPDGPVDVFWNGHASNLHNLDKLKMSFFENDMDLSDFYTGNSVTWFDTNPINITLSSFSNDIMDFDGEVTFENVIINSLLVSENNEFNNASVSNLNVLQLTTSNINTQDTFTSNVYTKKVNTTDVNTTNIVTTNVNTSSTITDTLTASNVTISQNLTTEMLNVIQTIITYQVETQVAIIKDTLYTSNLHVANHVQTSLVPDTDVTYDLGTPDQKWRDLYLSSGSLHIDEMVLSSEQNEDGNPTLDVGGVKIGSGGVQAPMMMFPDGTQMGSLTDVVSAVNDGETFGDFSDFTMIINPVNKEIQSLTGKFIYSINHDISEKGNRWNIYHFENYDVLPILADGTGVDTSKGIVAKNGGSPNNIRLPFIHNQKFIGEEVYFANNNEKNVNEFANIRTLDPYSNKFKQKAKANFNYFYNIYQTEIGSFSSGKTLYVTKDYQYINLNNITEITGKASGSKTYTLECIIYYKSPKYEEKFLNADMRNEYLISSDPQVRLNQIYKNNLDEYGVSTFTLSEVNTEYGLYPYISLVQWENSVNNLEFNDVIYTSDMGWGISTLDNEVIYNKFNTNGWLKELFKITYMYIKYGDIYESLEAKGIDDDFLNNLDTHYNNLIDSTTITLVNNEIIETEDGTTIQNATAFCLNKGVFEQYI